MALFTSLAPADIDEVARVFRLGHVRTVDPLWAGTVNSNFRVEAEAGAFFLRVNEGKHEAEVAYEAELVAHLAAAGVPTPRPVAAEDGRPYARTGKGLLTLFPWVAGAHRERGGISPHDTRALGAALAAVHLAGRGFGPRRESRYAFPRLVARWEGLCTADTAGAAPDVRPALAEIGREIDLLRERRAALPGGPTHGDLFPDNVLFEGDALTALLDFEQAADGPFAYDLAVCLCSWCFGGAAFDAPLVAGLVAGYVEVRPPTAAEREGLWIEARAAAMRFAVTRLTDVELNPQASEMTRRTKDFRRFLARLRALQAMGAVGFAALTS